MRWMMYLWVSMYTCDVINSIGAGCWAATTSRHTTRNSAFSASFIFTGEEALIILLLTLGDLQV